MSKRDLVFIVVVFVVFFGVIAVLFIHDVNSHDRACKAKFGSSYTRGYEPLDCINDNGEKKALQP